MSGYKIGEFEVHTEEGLGDNHLEQGGRSILLHVPHGYVSLGDAEKLKKAAEQSDNPTKFLEEKIKKTKERAAENWGHRKK